MYDIMDWALGKPSPKILPALLDFTHEMVELVAIILNLQSVQLTVVEGS